MSKADKTETSDLENCGEALLAIARDAVAACHGRPLCQAAAAELGDLEGRRVHLVGAGKAAGAMAQGVIDGLAVPVQSGLLVTKDDHFGRFAEPGFEVRFASHPVPDRRSLEAAKVMVQHLRSVPAADQLVAVLSGGASALLAAPLDGLTLADLARATEAMLGAGVVIEQLNVVRKHLTRASGGRLAAACAAPVQVLLISDVIGDDLSAIGSGPFAPDPSSFADALEIAAAVDGIGASALAVLEQGAQGALCDTPGPEAECFAQVHHQLLASHQRLIEAALAAARSNGFDGARRLPTVADDVRAVAARLAEAAEELKPGELIIGGGEPTVELPPEHGLGGRNQQLALLMARALAGERPACFVALGSDGTDGPTDAAGAVVDHRSWAALCEAGDPELALAHANAYPLLDEIGALVRSGPTGTNVLDLHLLAIA
jgi:glycerate 2-kinase